MARMQTRRLALAIAAGLACFAGGVVASRLFFGSPSAPPPAPPDGGVSLFPTDAAGPRIFIDPDSIQLLPDASLRLDLRLDAGEP
jgi:hypothetical protein